VIEKLELGFYELRGFSQILLPKFKKDKVLLHRDITDKIIKAFYNVYNSLGYGFLEKVYENAMLIELRKLGLNVQKQVPIKVFYDEQLVGQYFADIIVEETIIVELKAAEGLREEHEFQLINYLKATDLEIGLLINFGKTPQFKRKIFTN
jgi:GxxExxY protein